MFKRKIFFQKCDLNMGHSKKKNIFLSWNKYVNVDNVKFKLYIRIIYNI